MKSARFAKRWLWIIVAIVIVGGVVLVLLFNKDKTEESKLDKAIETAGQFTDTGNYDQALATLQQAQNDAKGAEQQLLMLSNLAAAAANAGKLQEALDYYAQKRQLDANTAAADGLLVGELYERLGENQKAIEQFEAYLGYITANPTEENAQARIDSVTVRIEQLKEGL